MMFNVKRFHFVISENLSGCVVVDLCLSRKEMDKADVYWSISDPSYGLRHSFLYQLYCYLLPRLQSHPIWHHGECLISSLHEFNGTSLPPVTEILPLSKLHLKMMDSQRTKSPNVASHVVLARYLLILCFHTFPNLCHEWQYKTVVGGLLILKGPLCRILSNLSKYLGNKACFYYSLINCNWIVACE